MANPQSPEKRSAERSRAVVHVFVFVGGIALYLLLGLVLWWALNRYIDPQTPTQKRDVVQILALIMAGVAGAVGIYFTWRGQGITQEGQQISRENIEVTRESTEEQVRLTQEGQNTERFTRALDQLGATDDKTGMKRLEIRLGAIYELGQVSRVSQVFREPILQVLTAYVRENAPAAEVADEPNGMVHPPTSDIEAILDVLSRRAEERVPEEHRVPLNLREANLQRTDLQGVDLQGANLRRANLQGANLQGANLQGANLQEAKLYGAELRGANLQGALLQEANLQRAFLQGAELRGANLQGAELQEAYLEVAHLIGANLQYAYLKFANLRGAFLQGAELREANLQEANLQLAHLQGTNLMGAKLEDANLYEADFTDEQLADARDLQGATMPDGQKYEDWLKDKEGGGKDVENE